jgi:cellulose synthase/poly-beta-1,6-N-acetylglucosamine synthase-like glycosyltransferase
MNFYTKNINKLKKKSPLQFGEHKKKINKKKLLITIITVVKNDEKKILSTLNSVFSQKYSNIEFIVIDGASSDRTLDIIKQNEKKLIFG